MRKSGIVKSVVGLLTVGVVLCQMGCSIQHWQLIIAAGSDDARKVQDLLNKGADVNGQDGIFGLTPLIVASRMGHQEVVRLLVDRKADIRATDNRGSAALMIASAYGHVHVAKLLLDQGAEVNTKNHNGGTALMMAALGGRYETARLLLENGADANMKSVNGTTALDAATSQGYGKIVELLKGKSLDHGPLLLTLQVKSDQPASSVMDAIRKRAAALGASDGDVVQVDPTTVSVRLPGYNDDTEKAVRIMENRALLEFRVVDEKANVAAAERGDIPEDDEVLYQVEQNLKTGLTNRRPLVVKKQILMAGDSIIDARVQPSQKRRLVVEIEFNRVGAHEFERITSEHVSERLAIVLDRRVYAAPVIKARIPGGKAVIEWPTTPGEAEELALVLRCGPIAAPVEVVKCEWEEPSSGNR
jgi:ankyrin repeat protein